MSVESLRLKDGEQLTDGHARQLASAIDQATPLGGVGIRETSLPWGTIRNYDARGGTFTPEAFAPRVIRGGFRTKVRFRRGLIAGIEPTIDGTPISQKHATTGLQPFVSITSKDYNGRGEAFVFARLTFLNDWTYDKVEVVVRKDPPIPQPREAFKLLLIVFRNGKHWRALHSSQNHLAVARRPDGRAVHLFWSTF